MCILRADTRNILKITPVQLRGRLARAGSQATSCDHSLFDTQEEPFLYSPYKKGTSYQIKYQGLLLDQIKKSGMTLEEFLEHYQ